MITVCIDNDGTTMRGHTGHHIDGQDLVCAAVSALTCSLIYSLKHLSGNRIRAETEDGKTVRSERTCPFLWSGEKSQ